MAGKFDFQFRFTPDETQFGGHPPRAPGADRGEPAPGLGDALEQQLGLRLATEMIPVDMLVVDRVERPSAN